jgi:hypothetical protein
LILAIDALQPEGDGIMLYVLYEVLSSTPVAAIQLSQPTAKALIDWLQPYQAMTELRNSRRLTNNRLRSWGSVSQRTMWSDLIVELSPHFDKNLRLLQ